MSGYRVIVVGGGVGGSAAALRAAQYHLRTAWILGDRGTAKSSRARYVLNIDNMIGIHEGVLKPAVMDTLESVSPECARAVGESHYHIGTQAIADNVIERLRDQYSDQVDLIEARGNSAERTDTGFRVSTANGPVEAPYLVLATGVTDRQPRIKKALPSGKTLDEIHWVFPYANHETFLYCIRCEGHLTAGTPTAVIGFSRGAAQVAMMLHERYGTPVTLLTNGEEAQFSEEDRRLLEAYAIGVRSERLVNILGVARAGALEGFEPESGDPVQVRFAFVVLGLERVFNNLAVEVGCSLEPGSDPDRQHVLVDFDSETDVLGCFAVGDMTTHPDRGIRKQVYTSQEYAVRAIDAIDRRIRSARRKALLNA